MDRNGLATACRLMLNELGTSYVNTASMHLAIDAGVDRVNLDSGFNRADVTVSIHSGAREITIPTGVHEIFEARLGTGTDRDQLSASSRAKLNAEEGDWESGTAGTPTKYFCNGMYVGFHPKPIAREAWTASAPYAVGDIVIPSTTRNGFTYKCTVAGTSQAEPTWPTTLDGTASDGDCTWQQDGHHYVYLRCVKAAALMTATETPTWLPRQFQRTIAKAAALEFLRGFEMDDESTPGRVQTLLDDYMRDVAALRALASGRAREKIGQIRPVGYKTFRG